LDSLERHIRGKSDRGLVKGGALLEDIPARAGCGRAAGTPTLKKKKTLEGGGKTSWGKKPPPKVSSMDDTALFQTRPGREDEGLTVVVRTPIPEKKQRDPGDTHSLPPMKGLHGSLKKMVWEIMMGKVNWRS